MTLCLDSTRLVVSSIEKATQQKGCFYQTDTEEGNKNRRFSR